MTHDLDRLERTLAAHHLSRMAYFTVAKNKAISKTNRDAIKKLAADLDYLAEFTAAAIQRAKKRKSCKTAM